MGCPDGWLVGCPDGCILGWLVGCPDDWVGWLVGCSDGIVGWLVGCPVGKQISERVTVIAVPVYRNVTVVGNVMLVSPGLV